MAILSGLLRLVTLISEIINPRVMAFVVIIGLVLMVWLGVSFKERVDPLLGKGGGSQQELTTKEELLTKQDEIIKNLQEQVRRESQ